MSAIERFIDYIRSLGPLVCFVLCVVSVLELLHQFVHLTFYVSVWSGDCGNTTKSYATVIAVVEVGYYFFWGMVLMSVILTFKVKPKRVVLPEEPGKYI